MEQHFGLLWPTQLFDDVNDSLAALEDLLAQADDMHVLIMHTPVLNANQWGI